MGKQMRRIGVGGAAVAAVAALAVGVLLLAGNDWGQTRASVGPSGGTVADGGLTVAIPPRALSREVAARVELGGESAVRLLSGLRPLAPVHSIELDPNVALKRPAEIRFQVDDVPRGPRYVATRKARGEMWTLQRARRGADGEVVVTVDDFSLFQPLEDLASRAAARAETAVATLLRLGGVRAREPRCEAPPFGYLLSGAVGSGDANALVFACLERDDTDMAVHVVNNRGIGMEYSLPGRLRVGSLTSPQLPDALMDAVRRIQGGTSWRSISATGEVVLTGAPRELAITVEPTLRSFAFDLALFAIGRFGGKAAKAAVATNYVECVREAAHRLGKGAPQSAGAALEAALGVWRRCGDTLASVGDGALSQAGALFFGGMKLGTGATDAVAELLQQQRVELRVEKAPPAVLTFAPAGAVDAVGPFSVSSGDRTIGDAVAAFGEPATIEPGPTGCEVAWPALGLKADAVNYGNRAAECTLEGGYVNDFVIASGLFQTEEGLRVGMTESELLARHPEASTRGGAPVFDDEPAPSGTLYGLEHLASPISATGILLTLKALVREGRVVALEVTPLLGGD